MQLSERDRKLLWGRAASRCAHCQAELVVDATVSDRDSIIGDEAHIISDSPGGPRGNSADRSDLSSYRNAILLCKVHHKMVDDQPNTYTTEVVRRMKMDHEAWVSTSLTDSQRADAEEVASAVARLERAEEDKRQYLLRRFGPSNWCVPPSANGTELIVRCAIALPGPVQLGPIPSQRGVITQLSAEAREDLIVAALNSAELTQRVRAMQSKWHWSGEGGWHALGGAGSLELTRLELDLRWLEQRIRQPVALTCAVLTGVTDDGSNLGEQCHGLVTVIDLALNVIELDAHRRPSQVAHRTTPAPAPAALTLAELADILSTLLTAPDVALTLSDRMLEDAPRDGHLAMWLMLNGVELERVVSLENLERLSGGLMVTQWEMHSAWPHPEPSNPTTARGFVAEFLEGLLEKADYRRFQTAVEEATGQSSITPLDFLGRQHCRLR